MADYVGRGSGGFDVENHPGGAKFFEGSELSGGIHDHEVGFPIDFDGYAGEVFVGDTYGGYELSVHEIDLNITGVVLNLAYHGPQRVCLAGENCGNYSGSHAVILKGVGQ